MKAENQHEKSAENVFLKKHLLRCTTSFRTDCSPLPCPFKSPENARSRPIFRVFARDAIEVAWNRGRLNTTNQLLGVNLFNERDKPANGEFISLISVKVEGE